MSVAALITRLVAQVSGELVDELAHLHSTLDRLIVREEELRGPAQVELAGEAALQHTGCALERRERLAPAAAPSRGR